MPPRSLRLLLAGASLCLALGAGAVVAVHPGAEGAALRTTEAPADGAAAVASEADGYAVTMSPVGTVRFRRPPERVVTQDANYDDMLVAVGRGETLLATGTLANSFDGFYAQLPGVEPGVDLAGLQPLSGGNGQAFDKERLYALRADVHHIDPLQLARSRNWTKADVDEISRNVGPFFANRYSRENAYPGPEPYEFYDVWQLATKVAEVHRRPERIARLKAIGDALTARLQAGLPPVGQRPTVGLIYYDHGRITPYGLGNGGFGQAQYAAIGARDAFEGRGIVTYGQGGGRGQALDLEGLLAIDPDVLIMPFAIYGAPGGGQGARAAYEQLLALRADPLARRLKAFRSGQVHPGGSPLQGPIFYLFQLEMAAKQVYPQVFGRYRDDQAYPPGEQLFDRAAVAAILAGAP